MGIYRDAYAGRHGVISEVQVEAVSADTQTHSEQKAPQELGVVDMTDTTVVDVQSHAHACEAAMGTHPTGSHTHSSDSHAMASANTRRGTRSA